MRDAKIEKQTGQHTERIFHLLCREKELTKQEIAAKLQLSMPTALQNINLLLENGFLQECGTAGSTGGRRAKKICLNPQAGYSVGINIALHGTDIALTDLLGNVLRMQTFPQVFCDEPTWYEQFSRQLDGFLQGTGKIAGACISFPGIVDMQAGLLMRSHIFGLEHISLNRFFRAIPYPAMVENDANCACFAELTAQRDTYLYLSLNRSVGGAVMYHGGLLAGRSFQAGEFGHMLLVPGGNPCYCGKNGCADAYLSPDVLGMPVETFFHHMEAGQPDAVEKWQEYLNYLAILVTNLRMAMDFDIILGGTMGIWVKQYFTDLCKKAAQYDRFARDVDYLIPCTRAEEACAAGAAKLALERYANRLLEDQKEIL